MTADDGTSLEAAAGIECVWKVVTESRSDDGSMKYMVAFDWDTPVETREELEWADVEGLVALPTSFHHPYMT